MSIDSELDDLTITLQTLTENIAQSIEDELGVPIRILDTELDTDTGEVSVDVELDRTELRNRLEDEGGDSLEIGIDGGELTISLAPDCSRSQRN